MKGYLPFSQSFVLRDEKDGLEIPAIVLRVNYVDLDPVTVARVRPFSISGDTLSFNTAAVKVRDGADVEEVLKRLPGVQVDMNGNVFIQGKKVEKVLVNGKEFFGGDVLLAIRNLPADVVGKLQAINDFGDRARLTGIKTGEAKKVLNIVFKQDKSNGKFGHVQGGIGTEGKYDNEAFGNAFNGDRQFSINGTATDNTLIGKDPVVSLNINYADQWDPRWGGGGTAGVSRDAPQTSSVMTQSTYYPGEQLSQQQTAYTEGHKLVYSANGNLVFRPDSNRLLRNNITFSASHSEDQSGIQYATVDQEVGFQKTTKGVTSNNSRNKIWTATDEIYYEKIIPGSRRRYSIGATIMSTSSNQNADDRTASSILTNNVSSKTLLHLLISNPVSSYNLTLNGLYLQPVGPTAFLELGYNGRFTTSFNDRVTQTSDSNDAVFTTVDSLSMRENYQAIVQHLHGGYTARIRGLHLTLGLDLEQGSMGGNIDNKGDKSSYRYMTLLPAMQANAKITGKGAIFAQYQTATIAPNLQQVSSTTDLTNPRYPIAGNPGLKPSYTHNASIRFERENLKATRYSSFGVGLNYSLILSPIALNVTHPHDTTQVVQYAAFVNSGPNNGVALDFRYTAPSFFNNGLRITANSSVSRNRTSTMADGHSYFNQSISFNYGLNLQWLIPDAVEVNLQTNYSTANTSYSSAIGTPAVLRVANFTLGGKLYLLSHWSWSYAYSGSYFSSGGRFQSVPAAISMNFQRELLRHNRAMVIISGFNLLDNKADAAPSMTDATVSQTHTGYIGRFFMLTLNYKLQKFH
jgi:hypothetical protein